MLHKRRYSTRSGRAIGRLLDEMRKRWTPALINRYLLYKGAGTPDDLRAEVRRLGMTAAAGPGAVLVALADDVLTNLDMEQNTPKYFTVGVPAAGSTASLEDSWTLTLTRAGASSGYGAYTVTFTQDGYDSVNSTIEGMPDINPMGS